MSKNPTKGERRGSQRQKARSKKGMRSAGKWFKSSYRDAVKKRLAAEPGAGEPTKTTG
ncbi:MAG: hypothetical protein HY330_01615 [Chloroflexi bacterium]|nr:hypothetical protein [Chloroflexota bacterium]